MPTIVGALGGMDLYLWTFTAYIFTATLMTPVFGKLADLYGRKRVLQGAILVFILGSAACGLSQNMPQLILFRALQGIGAGGVLPVTQTIFGDLFSPAERGRFAALISSVWGFCALLGPAVGSAIVSTIGWRWVFTINVPIGLAAMILLAISLRETIPKEKRPLDWLGALILATALGALMFAVAVGGGQRGWGDPLISALFAVAALGLATFVYQQQRTREPLLPMSLFRLRIIAVSSAVSVLFGVSLIAAGAFGPLLAQGALGGSVFLTAVLVAAQSLGWSAGSAIGGRLVTRWGYRRLAITGQALQLLGPIGLVLLRPGMNPAWTLLWIPLMGLGFGLSNIAYTIGMQNAVPWERRGVVTSTLSLVRNIGQTVGSAALGAVLAGRLVARLAELPGPVEEMAGSGGGMEGARALLDADRLAALLPGEVQALRLALDGALDAVFATVAAAGVLALALALLMPRGRPSDLDHRSAAAG